MTRDGIDRGNSQELELLISELKSADDWLADIKLSDILAFGQSAVPYLEQILQNALQDSSKIDLARPPTNSQWNANVHALFLIAHLKSADSLGLVLEFLSQKQNVLDYQLPDIVSEDIWEIGYLLGQNQLNKLQDFVLNDKTNESSRLAVVTALIQMALNIPVKQKEVGNIFKKVMQANRQDSDFIGLVASELMDMKDESLRPVIIEALQRNDVWSGIISAEEVDLCYRSKQVRKRAPSNIFDRFQQFREYTHFSTTSPRAILEKAKQVDLSVFP